VANLLQIQCPGVRDYNMTCIIYRAEGKYCILEIEAFVQVVAAP